MKLRFLVALALVASLSATAADSPAARANNTFGFNLFNRVSKETEKGNKFLSPISAYLALSMVYNGAQGDTARDMARALAFGNMSRDEINAANGRLIEALRADRDFVLSIANSLWTAEGTRLLRGFEDRCTHHYRATVNSLDFAGDNAGSVRTINDWVRRETRNKIDSIVSQLPTDALLVLINATYFSADWDAKFEYNDTVQRPFRPAGANAPVNVPTMHRMGRYKMVTHNGAKAIDLPYKGGAVSMVVVLPPATETVDAYARSLNGERWSQLVTALDAETANFVKLDLPKLKLPYEETLNDALAGLGMGRIFANGAQFGEITNDPRGVKVSQVKQKTFLEVDEEGTRAAAVTAVTFVPQSAILGVPEFKADRPYLFAIRHKTNGAVLFVGTVKNPEGGVITPRPASPR